MNKRTPEINSALKQARKARGWTQQELADNVGVAAQTIRSWEKGNRFPTPAFRQRLADVLKQTPEELGFVEKSKTTQELSSPPTVLPSFPPLLSLGFDENRRKMIGRVRSRWIFGVLERSIYRTTLIVLGLSERPEAVTNPWNLRRQENVARTLPIGTRIMQVYDQAGGELLILGEPGSGKTTLLLELARDLLQRAEADLFSPIPVIFNLSSWSERQPLLTDWLVEELQVKYQIPMQIGRQWVHANQLLLLLDGLDEVEEALRPACIDAINQYHADHHSVPLVLCSRETEYLSQTQRVALQQAVEIQPLTQQQIDAYLSSGGDKFIRDLLREDEGLRDLAKTPLMLTIFLLSYDGSDGRLQQELVSGSPEGRRVHVLTTYVQRMLSHRGFGIGYPPPQTLQWLGWLAQQQKWRSQTEFYLEHMQPDWLQRDERQPYRQVITRLVYGLEIVVCSAIFAWLRGGTRDGLFGVGAGLLGQLGAGPGNTILGWMAPGLGGGLAGGGSLGIIMSLINLVATLLVGIGKIPALSLKAFWCGLSTGIRNGLIISLLFGSLSTLLYHFIHWPGNIVLRGLGTGIFSGLLAGLMTGLIASLRYDQDVQRAKLKKKAQGWSRLFNWLTFTFCGALGFAVVDFLEVGFKDELLIYGVIIGLFYGFLFSLSGASDLIDGLGAAIKPAEFVAWSWNNVRHMLLENIKKGLLLGCAVMLPVSIVIGAASGIFYGVAYGLHYGLIYGFIIGMVVGLAAILAGVLDSGWSSGILDAREHFRPNEGIRRSIGNALFAASLFGPLAGVVTGLVCAFSFGFVGGLSGWLILGSGFAIVTGILFALQFFLLHGGIAFIEHYVLRWHLYRAGSMPWKYVRFLDYAVERILLRKVGGGYLFVHRIFLDYFAHWQYPSRNPHEEDAPQTL